MGFKAKTKGGEGDWPQAPVGNHRAVCNVMVNLGHHYEEFKAKKPGDKDQAGWKEKVYLCFELLDEMQDDGSPWVVGKMYTLSLNERAALSSVYQSLVGPVPEDEEADITPILGKACMVEIGPSSNPKYTELKKVSGPLAQDRKKAPKSVRPALLVDIDEQLAEEWLPRIYGQTVQQVMADSREHAGAKAPQGKANGNGAPAPAGAAAV